MNPARFFTYVESIHPWLYELTHYPDDVQPKRRLDKLLRGIESHVEWYITEGMVHELHTLGQKTGKGDLLTMLKRYQGNQMVTGPIGKIRQLGKHCKYWRHWTDAGFPCVEHVRPISGIIKCLLIEGKELYHSKFYDLTSAQKIEAAMVLWNVMHKSPICLTTQSENRRLLKNKRGYNPWDTYDSPTSGNKINRILIRKNILPCKDDLHMVLST